MEITPTGGKWFYHKYGFALQLAPNRTLTASLRFPDTGASVQALQITLSVPAFVETGQNVTLSCDHDADAAELYTLKWYRLTRSQKTQKPDASTRGREFVRYTPKEIPSMKYFTQNGLTVDVSGVYKFGVYNIPILRPTPLLNITFNNTFIKPYVITYHRWTRRPVDTFCCRTSTSERWANLHAKSRWTRPHSRRRRPTPNWRLSVSDFRLLLSALSIN